MKQAKQYIDFREYLVKKLRDPEKAICYLKAILEECKDCDEEESQKLLSLAIEDVAMAQGDKQCKELLRYIQREQWLFDPKNKTIVDELKKALNQKADRDIDLDSLEEKVHKSKIMKYKGYTGRAEYDDEAKIFHGEVLGLRDIIAFQADNAKDIEQEFHISVDVYLEWCKERNEKPEKPSDNS